MRIIGGAIGFVLLWIAFDLSWLVIWGATGARRSPVELTAALLLALILAQPVALWLCYRVVRSAD